MNNLLTAERVSNDISDNYVFQRSLLAYYTAANHISNRVLEIGTGTGYGITIVAPKAKSFITIDKNEPSIEILQQAKLIGNTEFRKASVPPLPFADNTFDFVISFQVIEHIPDDKKLIQEVKRVLRPGGKFIVTTPNKKMSLTRNPWHIREYTAEEGNTLLKQAFSSVESLGVFGNEKIMEYYQKNKERVENITRWDILNLQYHLPRQILQIPYDILNRMNRNKLHKQNSKLTESIRMEDYYIGPVNDQCFDLFYIAEK